MDFSSSPVTFIIIALNVVFSFTGFSNTSFLNKMIGWPYYEKRNNQYYRFISSGFLHADWPHLIFNMFTLFFFGRNLEFYLSDKNLGGPVAYIVLYFVALIIADLPGYFKHRDDVHYRSLGASGAVSAVVFGAIVFDPWSSIYLYGALKLSAALYAVLYIVYCVYAGKRGTDNVNHDAHLWGSIFGLIFIIALIGVLRPDLFPGLMDELRHPSFFGNG